MTSQTLSKRFNRYRKPDYLLRRSIETYRLITSLLRMLPEFLIIGVQKGGTTSLYRYL